MEIITLVLGYCATNIYIVVDNGEAIVIDPAADGQAILDFLKQRGLTPKYVLVTHAHYDHIGGVAALCNAGAKVYMSTVDYSLINSADVFYVANEFSLDVAVRDGDVFNMIGHKIAVMETAGHTIGGVCYILDDEVIFTGDTLFAGSIGRTDFPHGDARRLQGSIKKLCALDGNLQVFSGHGKRTTLEIERRTNPYVR